MVLAVRWSLLHEFAKCDITEDEFAKYDFLLHVANRPGECGKAHPRVGEGNSVEAPTGMFCAVRAASQRSPPNPNKP